MLRLPKTVKKECKAKPHYSKVPALYIVAAGPMFVMVSTTSMLPKTGLAFSPLYFFLGLLSLLVVVSNLMAILSRWYPSLSIFKHSPVKNMTRLASYGVTGLLIICFVLTAWQVFKGIVFYPTFYIPSPDSASSRADRAIFSAMVSSTIGLLVLFPAALFTKRSMSKAAEKWMLRVHQFAWAVLNLALYTLAITFVVQLITFYTGMFEPAYAMTSDTGAMGDFVDNLTNDPRVESPTAFAAHVLHNGATALIGGAVGLTVAAAIATEPIVVATASAVGAAVGGVFLDAVLPVAVDHMNNTPTDHFAESNRAESPGLSDPFNGGDSAYVPYKGKVE